jgi:serine/threonine protein kinase
MQNSISKVDQIVANYLLAVETGDGVDLQTLYEKHPEHADELRQFFSIEERLFDSLARRSDTLPSFVKPEITRLDPHRFSEPKLLDRDLDFYRREIVIDGYEIVRVLGIGGMGIVFEAKQTRLDRNVAIKVLREGVLASQQAKARFEEEAKLVAKFQHDHIVNVIEFGEVQNRAFLVMPLIEGTPLNQAIRSGPLAQNTACRLMLQVSDAITTAHDQGVIHRDIKPANILADDAYQNCKVADFGLAVNDQSAERMTRTGDVVGTPGYLAPEIIKGTHKGDALTDVYSLGATLYALLTGVPPFRGASAAESLMMAMASDPVAPRKLNPNLAIDIESICLKCMNPARDRRYQTVGELHEDLHRFLDRKPVTARPVSNLESLSRWANRNRGLASAVAASVVLLLGLIGLGAWSYYEISRSNKDLKASVETQGELTEKANESLVGSIKAIEEFFNKVGTSEVLRDTEASLEFRKDLLTDGIGFLNEFLDNNKENELLQLHVGRAYGMLSQMHDQMRNQTDRDVANEKALETFKDLYRLDSDDLVVANEYAGELLDFATFRLRENGLENLRPKFQLAIDVSRPVVESIKKGEYGDVLAAHTHFLARLKFSRKSFDAGERIQSLAEATEAANEYREIVDQHPEDSELLAMFAEIAIEHGILHDLAGDPSKAGTQYETAREFAAKSLKVEPGNSKTTLLLADAIGNLMMTVSNRRRIAGEELTNSDRTTIMKLALEAYEIKKGLAEKHPGNFRYRLDFVEAMTDLATALINVGDHDISVKHIDLASEILKQELPKHPLKTDPDDWYEIVRLKQRCIFQSARLCEIEGNYETSLELLREANALAEQFWIDNRESPLLLNQLHYWLLVHFEEFHKDGQRELTLSIDLMLFEFLARQESLFYNKFLIYQMRERLNVNSRFFVGDLDWPQEYRDAYRHAYQMVGSRKAGFLQSPEKIEAIGRDMTLILRCLESVGKSSVLELER